MRRWCPTPPPASVGAVERRIRLIVNPVAGGGRAADVLPDVEAFLGRLRLDFTTKRTRNLEHARELARGAVAEGDVAVTLSGDGLVGAVAGELAGHDGAVLGVLPCGRGNDFARVLGIPLDDLEAACSILRDGVERDLDIGDIGGRPFIGIASFGLDSDANRIANDASPRLGNFVYTYGALRALAQWKPATFTLELDDGEPQRYTGFSVAVANSKAYGGGMFVAPDAELDDGLLDIVISETTSKWVFLRNLPKVFKGEHVNEPGVHVLRAREVRVSADRPFAIYADGDPIAQLPATIGLRHKALRVICPQPA